MNKDQIQDSQDPQGTDEKENEKSSPASDIEVSFSDDASRCWLSLSQSKTGALPEKSAVIQALESHNISKDLILEEELNRIFDELIVDEKVLIAEGKPKQDGKNGEVRYNFKISMTELLENYEHEQIDVKQIDFMQYVKKGDVVAELLPPENGTDGITVTGSIIKADAGKPTQLPSGINVEISSENPNQLCASSDGVVSLKGDELIIDSLVTIEGDVDYETGNVDYRGSVLINKDVKPGFSIKSGGDVVIEGSVEDAVIEAGGNVVVKGEFTGKGTGRINAGGCVILTFTENQVVLAGGDVFVSDALLHVTVEADGNIVISGSKGVIGGSLYAGKSITIQSAGSQTATETVLNVGLTREQREKGKQYIEDKKNHKINVEKVSKAITVLNKINIIKRGLPDKQKKLYRSLIETQKQLKSEVELLTEIGKGLESVFKEVENASISVHQRVYPNVRIEFGHLKKVVKEHGIGVKFRIKDKQIGAFKITQ